MAPNPIRPGPEPSNPNAQQQSEPSSSGLPKKKKTHRGGKKRRNRRHSFVGSQDMSGTDIGHERSALPKVPENGSFYRTQSNLSNTSLESEALLDHREHPTIRTRRPSVPVTSIYQPRPSQSPVGSQTRLQGSKMSSSYNRSRLSHTAENEGDDDTDDRTPLMSSSHRDIRASNSYGAATGSSHLHRQRRSSRSSESSSRQRSAFFSHHHHSQTNLQDYDVNNPPSVPTSPVFESNLGLDDVMITEDLGLLSEPDAPANRSRDALIDIDEPSPGQSPPKPGDFRRRMTTTALEDVCFPHDIMSEIGQDDYLNAPSTGEPTSRRRRRRWPDLNVLEAWAHEEKEQRTIEGMRMRKVSEPLMVEGRLRPRQRAWHREASDAPFRFTYFNENFDNTIHSQSIHELLQPGQTYRNLFVPDPPLLDDSSDGETDDEEEEMQYVRSNGSKGLNHSSTTLENRTSSGEQTRSTTPRPGEASKTDSLKLETTHEEQPKRYGPRPAWWLDVLSPTETEMKVISKAFGIHPLTSEDILMQEQREKVELFKHYYFINYRTFEQDENSEDYLEPVNLYVVVFREGVISFHFSMTPHPANVRRRIRQLSDYLVLSPDWISYAIIDDITDAYAPMIQRIEEEVDDIDEAILRLHSVDDQEEMERRQSYPNNASSYEKKAEAGAGQESGRDMLRRVGECRKKVMSLYRLLGNKADVIKGFAKRCNEQWDIAPRNEIGMYLGDIQDHIVTMTGNLSHYEKSVLEMCSRSGMLTRTTVFYHGLIAITSLRSTSE